MEFVQRKFQKHIYFKPLSYQAIVILVKKFDVTETVGDLSCFSRPVTATTAEDRTELETLVP